MKTIENTRVFQIQSEYVGDQFEITLAYPENYETEKSYPLIVLTDGDLFFQLFHGVVKLLTAGQAIEPALLVAIGYGSRRQPLLLRTRDLTPCSDPLSQMAGGASNFHDFILEELLPEIRKYAQYMPHKKTLVGDSLGGLFGLYALLRKPEAFQNYLCGSPSLYFGQDYLFKYEDMYAADHDDLKAKVFMASGALEAVYEPAWAKMVDNVLGFSDRLRRRNYQNLETETHVFEGETHYSVIPAIFSRGLRYLMASDPGKEDQS